MEDRNYRFICFDRNHRNISSYQKEDLEAVVDTLTGTFSYSVDKKQLTLSEREYGEQMIFTKK